ncbi:S1/P1 nuclease [Simiduia aestuariiviva]|uniref:S1/P1 Nuclease n=1 Tax=Simiduia aestuariiviva TaxID=1510459 RepID=A0A839UKS9_9GAMM|nr:S1/P1 nuclease [Simiduia aestuariiviva]MBB3167189.1 hypothetical protein [Simiduia aestuariiviva]
MKLGFILPLAIVLSGFATHALALGANGHRIVAQLAEYHLTPEARAAVNEITRGQPLAQLSTWPDFLYSDSTWTRATPWHFVTIRDEFTVDNYPREKAGDVLQALPKFEAVLRDRSASAEAKWQALAFFTHFVGDVHQPLHVGNGDDLGGNTVKLLWQGAPSNLHKVWDTEMIQLEQLSYTEYTVFLDTITPEQIGRWQSASYGEWAAESKALRAQVYDFGDQKGADIALSWDYNFRNKATINLRMQQAGIRLAGKLNAIFAARKN